MNQERVTVTGIIWYYPLYNNLYFDTRDRSDCPFQVLVGGRGVGKTYSALRNLLFDADGKRINPDANHKFMYMRRLAKEIEFCTSDISNPFKRINRDYHVDVRASYRKKDGYAVFYDDSSTVESDEPLGYGVALSTFSGLRGVDFSDVDIIIFDEFIPERQVRKIKSEGKVFLNMYETVNRNRELQGEKPVKVLLLANSISMGSEILLEMGAVPTMASMILKDQHRATIKERGLYIELIDSKKLAEVKQKTALYRLTAGSEFNKEAIMNKFTTDNLDFAKKVKINEYKALFNFCEYTFYKHKSREEYYMAKRVDTAPIKYSGADVDILTKSFVYTYQSLLLQRRIYFDDYATKLVFDTILKLN